MASWIEFRLTGQSDSGKTYVWSVMTSDGRINLGTIKWFSNWRKYAFYPNPDTIWEQDCLTEIATFIVNKTAEHKRKVA